MDSWKHPQARVDNLILMASRSEVEARDISGTLPSLTELLDPTHATKLRGRLIFGIQGYEEDPRDLWEIPDVRVWMQDLDKEFPYWLYFMDLGRNSTLAFVAFSLCAYEKVPGGKMISPQDLQQFLISHFEAMNRLSRSWREAKEDDDRRSKDIARFFFPDKYVNQSNSKR